MTIELHLGERANCPCCGYPTLYAQGAYDICELCSWEDDGQGDANADEVLGGPNSNLSLSAARENFRRYLSIFPPDGDPRGIFADSDLDRTFKAELVALFDAWRAMPSNATTALFERIQHCERALENEQRRKEREHARSFEPPARPN